MKNFSWYVDTLLTNPEVDDLMRRAPEIQAATDVASNTRDLPTDAVDNPVSRYIPRRLDSEFKGMTDTQFITKAYEADLPILLYGPPGTGKTSMVIAALPETIVFPGTSETETSDLVGGWVQHSDGSFVWVDGPLVRAMETGVPLLIDEVALIDPRVLAVVYSVMDGRDTLTVTANPARGIVTAAPGFAVLGACNPDAPGAMLSDALLSRFSVHLEVLTDWALAAELGAGNKIITVARNLAKRLEAHEILTAPQLRELLTFRDIYMVFGEELALRNFVAQARESDRDVYAEVAGDVFGRRIIPLAI